MNLILIPKISCCGTMSNKLVLLLKLFFHYHLNSNKIENILKADINFYVSVEIINLL